MPEIGKTYLGKVVRLAEFGAFVEIFPGTDGLLHVSEIAEHRVKEVKDELREGDQILVKVLAIEGNRIKLSRKAVLREQRAKLGLPEVGEGGGVQASAYPAPIEDDEAADGDETILIEGGVDFDDDDDELRRMSRTSTVPMELQCRPVLAGWRTWSWWPGRIPRTWRRRRSASGRSTSSRRGWRTASRWPGWRTAGRRRKSLSSEQAV